MNTPKLYVAIPAMDELQDLPATLQDLAAQSAISSFEIYICVNQPEEYWQNPDKKQICDNNQQLLRWLTEHAEKNIHVLDYASPGKGWTGKKFGVGWARKVLFDHILTFANPDDIIVSLDADTRIRPGYLSSILTNFKEHPAVPAISVPYYHPLTGEEANDRAILRYEMYMRNYAINLYKIGSPYSFTAVGSAIAMRAGALKKVGGITPVKSGEDFYLVQKLRKMAPVSNWNEEMVYPAARFSDRVFFGTGPALIKGSQGSWESYPIYHHSLFKAIDETYHHLPELYTEDIETPFLTFLQQQMPNTKNPNESIWQSIRNNVKDLPHFVQAFHEKADGLRILQFLRQEHREKPIADEVVLYRNLRHWIGGAIPSWYHENSTFDTMSTEQLQELREHLFRIEMDERKDSSSTII